MVSIVKHVKYIKIMINSSWLGSLLSDCNIIGSPSINAYEETEGYFIEVSIPGLTKEEVSVTVPNDKALVIKLMPNKIQPKEDRVWIKREWNRMKPLSQEITLPRDIDKDSIKAKVENGVLLITIPKSTGSLIEIPVE